MKVREKFTSGSSPALKTVFRRICVLRRQERREPAAHEPGLASQARDAKCPRLPRFRLADALLDHCLFPYSLSCGDGANFDALVFFYDVNERAVLPGLNSLVR